MRYRQNIYYCPVALCDDTGKKFEGVNESKGWDTKIFENSTKVSISRPSSGHIKFFDVQIQK